MDVKTIEIANYNYPLTDDRIAKYPLTQRDESNLLYWHNNQINSLIFKDLPQLLDTNDILIYNNTKVIQARLHFKKITGATIEIFCLEPHTPSDYALVFQENKKCSWKCMIGNLKKWKNETLTQHININNKQIEFTASKIESHEFGMSHVVEFQWNNSEITFSDILQHFGELPIPPYLNRATEEKDKETYQTVYSKIDGSVAAPTAGLHFTKTVLQNLLDKGITEDEVTLHVGAGTFQPVKSNQIGNHPMHKEVISVKKSTIINILNKKGNIIAVGTTSVRTLESLYYIGCHINQKPQAPNLLVDQWEPYDNNYTISTEESLKTILRYLENNKLDAIDASTQIMIVPSFKFRIVDKIITNFHQPQSTLLLLISAFVGNENWQTIYNFALENNYRFLSYGDSSLLTK